MCWGSWIVGGFEGFDVDGGDMCGPIDLAFYASPGGALLYSGGL